jgi:hypothetical protein
LKLESACFLLLIIGDEEVLAVRTLPFSGAFHDPEPPGQSSDKRGSKGRKGKRQEENRRIYRKIDWLKRQSQNRRRCIFTPPKKMYFQITGDTQ